MNTTERKTISRLTRQANSENGNPQYKITFTDGTTALTPRDAQVGYLVSEYYVGKPLDVEFDGRGRVVHFEEVN